MIIGICAMFSGDGYGTWTSCFKNSNSRKIYILSEASKRGLLNVLSYNNTIRPAGTLTIKYSRCPFPEILSINCTDGCCYHTSTGCTSWYVLVLKKTSIVSTFVSFHPLYQALLVCANWVALFYLYQPFWLVSFVLAEKCHFKHYNILSNYFILFF